MLMEKLQGFAEGKYEVQVPAAQITDDYENRRTDAWEHIENMGITKRIVSTAKMMQSSRQNSSANSLGRSNTAMSSSTTSSLGRSMPPVARSPSAGSFTKKPPPPPPGSVAAPPPPYSAPSNGAVSAAVNAAAAKRAPPPPPPLKPKPRVEPPKEYVVAMFDFAPQVRRLCFLQPIYTLLILYFLPLNSASRPLVI